ncbi:MAG: hypothetical protein LBS57_04760 [Treponema sp.]|jgi:hypothetical protein|nr:hypothetical protein [Treponema sp.]
MDERRKAIEALEKEKRKNADALDLLFEQFGETLFRRLAAAGEGEPEETGTAPKPPAACVDEYFRRIGEIADSESLIKNIEADILRFRELGEKIESKEREKGERAGELVHIRGKLGKLVLEDPSCADFARPFRGEADALVSKVQSLENRLTELGEGEKGNVLIWIGKSAQGMVLRSFLARAEDNLERLYQSAGEQFCAAPPGHADGDSANVGQNNEIGILIADIEKKQELSQEIDRGLSELREERRKIGEEFGGEGGAAKKIQSLKVRIGQEGEALKALYRRAGYEAVSAGEAVSTGDRQTLESIKTLGEGIAENEREIEKLKASLEIDEEKAEIKKLNLSIEDRRNRIAAAKEDIAKFEAIIKKAEDHIGELQKIL